MRPWLSSYPAGVGSEINYSEYKNLLEIFDEAVSKFGDRPCFSNRDVMITYNQLDSFVTQFASFLQNELKISVGDRIIVQLPNVLQFPIVFFGALKVGAILVCTNPMYTAAEMSHQYSDSGASVAIILKEHVPLVEKIFAETKIKQIVVADTEDRLSNLSDFESSLRGPASYSFKRALEIGKKQVLNKVAVENHDVALLQYTGGTTAISKGAVISHKNIIANMKQVVEWLKPKVLIGQDVVVTPLPLYHMFSLTNNFWPFFYCGAENVLITNPRDTSAFIKELAGKQFSFISGINALLSSLLSHHEFEKIDFSKLKVSIISGSAIHKDIAEKWIRKTKAPVVLNYGLSECGVVTINPLNDMSLLDTDGLPLPSIDLKIVDLHGQEVAFGTPGEVLVRGPQVIKQYWNYPQVRNSEKCDDWFRTGDIAIMNKNGYLKIIDRIKDMILVSGFTVSPSEVENVIASHPGVSEVAVIGVSDERSGERVKAFIVKKDSRLTKEDVINHARKTLVAYKIPKYVEFCSAFPKSPVGKILKRELRKGAFQV